MKDDQINNLWPLYFYALSQLVFCLQTTRKRENKNNLNDPESVIHTFWIFVERIEKY